MRSQQDPQKSADFLSEDSSRADIASWSKTGDEAKEFNALVDIETRESNASDPSLATGETGTSDVHVVEAAHLWEDLSLSP